MSSLLQSVSVLLFDYRIGEVTTSATNLVHGQEKLYLRPRKHGERPSPPPILTFLGSKVFGHVGVVAV